MRATTRKRYRWLFGVAAVTAALWFGGRWLVVHPPWVPEDAVRVGGVHVNPALRGPMGRVEDAAGAVWPKCRDEGRFLQGYGWAPMSSGTHRDGWCLDIGTGERTRWTWRGPRRMSALTDEEVRVLVGALEGAGFAAPLRVKGYDLGNGFRTGTEHIHAAYQGKANYAVCRRTTRPGGKASLPRMLEARR